MDKEPKQNQEEEINLSVLFKEKKELGVYEFSYGPMQELLHNDKVVIYRVARNGLGIEMGIVLGVKASDAYEKEEERFVKVSSLSSEEKKEIASILKPQIRGKIDFL